MQTAAGPLIVELAGVPVQPANGVPLNSSAPISGAVPEPAYPPLPWRVSFSKSSVMPETFAPPLSTAVATPVFIFKKLAFPHVVLKNVGIEVRFSVTEPASRGDTLVLYAAKVASVLVPSVKIVEPKNKLVFDVAP